MRRTPVDPYSRRKRPESWGTTFADLCRQKQRHKLVHEDERNPSEKRRLTAIIQPENSIGFPPVFLRFSPSSSAAFAENFKARKPRFIA